MSVAIITGASSGIGEEFAKQLNALADITEFWFIARRRERMEKIAETLGRIVNEGANGLICILL